MQNARNTCSCDGYGSPHPTRACAVPASEEMTPTTVLIVDDHPSFRASARAILEAGGYDVVGEAEDGRSAIAATKELRPDVLLLDIQLPDMNGFDICSRLDGWNGAKPELILVSSRELADYGDQVETSCARGFLLKDELSAEAVAALLA
jgi:DNA-binding NarL/FixJ family response regulator